MHIGETSVRLTSLLAAGLRRPRLRGDVKVSRQVVLGEVSYVVKIPETDAFYRYDEFEWEVVRLFDGTRSYQQVWEELKRRDPETETTLAEVEDFVSGTDPGLWEKTLTEKNLALLEKIRDERKERGERSSLFYLSFSAWNPDRFFARVIPHVRWVWTPRFFTVTLGMFIWAVWMVVAEWNRFSADARALYSFQNKGLSDLLQLWALMFLVGFVHECGHGLTCKYYGGEVKQMGFMLIYFMPAFFTDVSDMYLFDKDAKRFWTIFAGIWITVVASALALLVWLVTPPGTGVNDWAYKLLLLSSISAMLINVNPLMKYDGYYALCQAVKVDNLREDAFQYLQNLCQRYLLGMKSVQWEEVGRRRRRIFLVFAPLAFAYSVFIIVFILTFIKNVLTTKFGLWGWVLTGVFAWLILRRRVRALGGFLRERLRGWRGQAMKWQLTRRVKLAGGAVVLAILVAPVATRISSDFVLEPGKRAFVRADTAGWVQTVHANEAQVVEAGALLGILRNPESEARAETLLRQLEGEERALAEAQGRGDAGSFRAHWQRREQLRAELADARAHRARLVLRAPIAGVVTTPRLAERVGQFLAEGETFCEVADRQRMRARVLVPDREVEEIRAGSEVKLNVRARPWRTFEGRVEAISPAAAQDVPPGRAELPERRGVDLYNYFAVQFDFSNPRGELWEGMTGTAKVYGRRLPLGMRWGRSVWRWARSLIW